MLIAAFAALLAILVFAPSAAMADVVGEDYKLKFTGFVTYNDDPLEGVSLTVEGGSYTADVVTDADGRWVVGVPDKRKYTVTLDESTLPDGVIVSEGGPTVEAEFGLTSNKTVNFFLGEGERVTVSFADQLFERIINGLNFSLMLALAAIGLSLVFGTTGISNFSHAEMVTFGAVMALVFGVFLGWPMWIAVPLAIALGGVFGGALDAGIWRPLRRKGLGLVPLMIVSIGLSLFLRYVYQFFISGRIYQLPGADSPKINLFGPISLTPISMISMGISVVVLAAVAWWLLRTNVGKATRAISDNPSLAAASGINVDGVTRIVWVLSGALAALSGVLWAYFRPGITWDMATSILLLMFAAVTLGGLGTAFGAVVGSVIVGMLVEVSTLFILPGIKYVAPLTVLIVVLLFRPQGILGRRERIG
ncbi:MAG: branched-chain amino acid ABC transporter permease [Microbacteriaceae bacterium]